MAKILCATRGGEASYKTQDGAIAQAKERNTEVVFLYVVDTHFLDKTERAVRKETVEREMDHMGEFLLTMAVERAKTQGVEASMLIRHGDFRKQLIAAVCEPDIETLVLGMPGEEGRFFSQEKIQAFAEEIRAETQKEVIVA